MKLKSIFTSLAIIGITYTIEAQNPIITEIYTADPAPLVYKNTVYLYAGHDGATLQDTNYKMPDWYVFSSKDMVNWKNHGSPLSPATFSWATGDAYAAHTVERNGKFYWFVSTFHKKDDNSQGGAAIGVAVSDSPVGPFKDAIGKALIVNEMTTDMKHGWDDIDPAVFIDDDGQAYLFWGNGSCKWVKLKENMIELDGPITTLEVKNYIEGPWIYKRKGLYYLIYAGKGTKAEMIEYATSKSIQGPWEYRGILAENASKSFTIHPGVIDFKGKTYFFYHNGELPEGGSYRRGICLDYLYFNEDGSMQKVIQTKEGVKTVKR